MRRSPLNKESPTHRERRKSYEIKKRKWLEEHPGCMFVVYDWDNDGTGRHGKILCGRTFGVTVHHRKGRGKYLDDERYFSTQCMCHHAWIHSHMKKARELGYILF